MTELSINQMLIDFKLSASELARIIHANPRTVQQWASGDRKPPEYVLFLIAYRLSLLASQGRNLHTL